jgi:hypothetical protein
MRPLRSPSEGRGGEVTAWQPEASPPLPPGVHYLCPRCGNEGEILRIRVQCRRCLYVFSPPRLPSWVLKALWEGSRPQGGLLAQGVRRWVR